jgi:ketosteroid isomerase-like protein
MRVIALAGLLALTACSCPGLSSSDTAAIRAEVEQALRDAYDLSKPEPLPRMLSLYPSSGRVVSANTGRVITSSDSIANGIREFWYYVGVNMRNPKWEWTNIYVDVLSRDAAVVTGTYRIPHLNPNNRPHVLGGAMTMVFKRQDGRWVVIQEHLSDTPQIADSASIMATPNSH